MGPSPSDSSTAEATIADNIRALSSSPEKARQASPRGGGRGDVLPTSLELAQAAARVAADNRGEDIVILDLRDLTPVFDYFVLVTGASRRQLHAISEEIDHHLEDDLGDSRMGIEGYAESRWILLDYGSVVVHLFDAETRDFYALEELWVDAKRIPREAE
ncbi:ribosome silencing factor [Botrimarina sp.]|uniref:ribosome silencing factor n=1 Tax=Botrimarina sp. TaxID=2795802 RepID=UPI0032EAF8CC